MLPRNAPRRLSLLSHAALALVAFAAAVLSFAPAVGHQTVYDDVYIVSSAELHSPWRQWLVSGWQRDFWGQVLNGATSNQQWRPASVAGLRLSLLLRPGCAGVGDRALTATHDACDAPPHACLAALHRDTVALHGVCAALLYWVAAGPLGLHPLTCLLASLLFALHPAHVESVATLYGRADVQALALQQLALLAAWRDHRALPLLLALLASLSKENGFTTLALIPLAQPRLTRACAASLCCLLALRGALIRPWGPPLGFTDHPAAFILHFPARMASYAWLHCRYVEALVWPWRQAINHGWDSGTLVLTPWAARMVTATCMYAAVAVAVAQMARRGARAMLFCAAWGFITFLPAANVAFPVGTTLGERLLYLPSAPFCILCAAAAERALRRLDSPRARPLLGALGVALAAMVFARLRSELEPYKCELRLWPAVLARYPRNALARHNAAVRFDTVGRHAEALSLYEQTEAQWRIEEAEVMRTFGVDESLQRNGWRRAALGRARVLRPTLHGAALDAGFTGVGAGPGVTDSSTSQDAAVTALKHYVTALNGQPDPALGARILSRIVALCARWTEIGALPLCDQARAQVAQTGGRGDQLR